jgi:PAS domain S-box-containing protein
MQPATAWAPGSVDRSGNACVIAAVFSLICDDLSPVEIATMNKLRHDRAKALRSFGIADKIYAIVAVLAILTTLLVVMAVQSVRLQTEYRNQLATSAKAALNVERVNGLIYAIVMDSRSIYLSTDLAKVTLYGDAILRRNSDLSKVMAEWQGAVRGDDLEKLEDFKKRINHFIDFRNELVRRATEISPAAGRAWGDNVANSAMSDALANDLAALEKIYAERASGVEKLGDQTRIASWYLAALGIAALLLAALNVFVVRRFVITPLAEITQATDGIAAGNTDLVIPYITRDDEIGRLAHAVQNFQDTLIHNMELRGLEVAAVKARDAAIGQRDSLDDKYQSAKWQLSAAVNNIAQGLVMLDSRSRVVAMNDQFRKMYRLPSDITAGNSLNDILRCTADNGLFTVDAVTYAAEVAARIAKKVPTTHENELADGRIIRIASRPMDDGGWVSTHDDCTAERRMQQTLERTERFLVTVIENVSEAIAAKDARSLRYVFVNRAAEKMFELPRTEILGKTARELFSLEIADLIERGDRCLLEGNDQLEPAVHSVETSNGRRVRAVRRIPVRGPDGVSRVFLSIIEDRSDWAQAGFDQACARPFSVTSNIHEISRG